MCLQVEEEIMIVNVTQWRQEEEQLPGEARGTAWLSLFIIAPQLDLFVNCDYICTPYNVNRMINRPRK